ncbi:protoporphyrinogen oxidase [Methanocella sp. CWC-04]|uniref:Protoporphyrinogen oxidase n=1 Tax=Methanooceanicella nereidis TaxID=2052831 RepID=A0AAP2RAS1_9EURY|nr:flavodoxin domain-containing protein [Methanocella sp. CWC-04]MCD1294064.1 protoporphyrinogen oxidase [Methanocella sp. CWC-04]
MKALVVYGTRGGATKGIADEIAKALEEQGYAATVKNARETKGINVNEFDLIVVGSSIWATKWKRDAANFLKRNAKALEDKKVALFASGLSGGDPSQREYGMKTYLEKVAEKYPSIKPISMGLFGGYVDFNSPNLIARIMGMAMKGELEKKGVDVSKPYDARDLPAVRKWALELAEKAKQASN